MASRRAPTIRQLKLGRELRDLREAAGVSQKDASMHIDGEQAKVSKIENGWQRVTKLELLALLKLYRATKVKQDALLTLLRELKKKGWWHEYDEVLPQDARDMIELEAECDRIIQFSNMTIPGLLQTTAYADAVIRGLEPRLPDDEVQLWIDVRMERQKIFERESPPQFICVLDESVLRRPVGGGGAMAAQLRKLVAANRQPKTAVRVVPFGQPVYPGLSGSFRALLDSSGNSLDVVEITNWTGSLYMQEPAKVGTYQTLFDEILASALPLRDSNNLILQIARDHEQS